MAKIIYNRNNVGSSSTKASMVKYIEADGSETSVQDKFNSIEVVVSLTQAEYDALPGTKLTDNKLYLVTDADDDMDAYSIPYKNSTVGDMLDIKSNSKITTNDSDFVDLNNLHTKGNGMFSVVIDKSQSPNGSDAYWYIMQMCFYANLAYAIQIAFTSGTDDKMYFRRRTGGTWDSTWKTIS